MMRIGDKVRLLRGKEEGVIVGIKGNIVEIEIEDGFTIPAVKNEVVLIDKKEAEVFRTKKEEESSEAIPEPKQRTISEGIYLGVKPEEDAFQIAVINQTENDILFSISLFSRKSITGLFRGICAKYEAEMPGNIPISTEKESIQLNVQIILHEDITRAKKLPLDLTFPVNKALLPNPIFINALEEHMSLLPLDKGEAYHFDPVELAEQMTSGGHEVPILQKLPQTKDQTVDLHFEGMNSETGEGEILRHQLELFEKALDNALFTNARSLKVIHGIGKGKLRMEIHKRLGQRTDVKYFEDTDKERFGFGSTIIYF